MSLAGGGEVGGLAARRGGGGQQQASRVVSRWPVRQRPEERRDRAQVNAEVALGREGVSQKEDDRKGERRENAACSRPTSTASL